MLGPRATPELRADLTARMGLDQPLPVQLGSFLARAATGDLGEDPFSNRQVTDIVLEQLPFTLALVLAAMAAATLLGVPLGCYSAIRRGSWLDRLTALMSVAVIAIPSFVVALYALLLLSVQLRWFPAIGAGESGDLADQAHHLVLPALALGRCSRCSRRVTCAPRAHSAFPSTS
jgi:peptide/nickel transport system permease protein